VSTWRGHRLISQSSAQLIHNQPSLSLCQHAYIAQNKLHFAKNISANLTHLSFSPPQQQQQQQRNTTTGTSKKRDHAST